MSDEKLYRIGQFAQLSGTSIKKLRYLDKKGILVPEVRDEKTNFRYYRHIQLDQIAIIQTLREFGIPFSDVVRILENRENARLIEAVQNRIEQADADIKNALFQYSKLISYHTQLFKGLSVKHQLDERKIEVNVPCSAGCEIVHVPEKTVIRSRTKGKYVSTELFVDQYFEILRLCNEKNVTMASSLMGVFHDGYLKQFDSKVEDLEAMVEIKKGQALDENVRRFGGFDGVSAYYRGHYRNMKEHYLQMAKWAHQQGIELADASLEIYIMGPDMTLDESEYITQVIIPFKGSLL